MKDPRSLSKQDSLSEIGEGIVENFDPELRRAFDFADKEIPEELRDPEKLRFMAGHLKVSGDGIFYTVQGEGKTTGEPAVFLRLQMCNLACVWCDAWYTWNPKTPEFWKESNNVPVEELSVKINRAWKAEAWKQKRLVITGGEPLIQRAEIDNLIDLLPDWNIEIETNGTLMPTQKQLQLCQFNCSPKLKNSKNLDIARIRPEVLKALNQVNTTFKFVVMTPTDIDEIEKDFIQPLELDKNKIMLMPQGVTPEEIKKNALSVVEYAKQKGYRMTTRLQVEIWGARRKV